MDKWLQMSGTRETNQKLSGYEITNEIQTKVRSTITDWLESFS